MKYKYEVLIYFEDDGPFGPHSLSFCNPLSIGDEIEFCVKGITGPLEFKINGILHCELASTVYVDYNDNADEQLVIDALKAAHLLNSKEM